MLPSKPMPMYIPHSTPIASNHSTTWASAMNQSYQRHNAGKTSSSLYNILPTLVTRVDPRVVHLIPEYADLVRIYYGDAQ